MYSANKDELTNEQEGRMCFLEADEETRDWFKRQWEVYPNRADERYTTNLSFLYGGVLGYREQYLSDPVMSKEFRTNVDWLDRHSQ